MSDIAENVKQTLAAVSQALDILRTLNVPAVTTVDLTPVMTKLDELSAKMGELQNMVAIIDDKVTAE